jgi:hypothetical protein
MRFLPKQETEFSSLSEAKIPMAQFTDMNLDAMFDLIFYHDKKIYTFYNQ